MKKSKADVEKSEAKKSSAAVSLRGYEAFLKDLKGRVRSAQIRAALSVNHELIMLYWEIGRDILIQQEKQGWGAKVIDRLSVDLSRAFPDMKGFSPRNLKYMRAFAQAWPDELFVQQLAAQIPWFHNCVLLDSLNDNSEREWYIRQTIDNGWSRAVLVHQIETDLYHRQVRAQKSQTFPLLFLPRNPTSPSKRSKTLTSSTSSHSAKRRANATLSALFWKRSKTFCLSLGRASP